MLHLQSTMVGWSVQFTMVQHYGALWTIVLYLWYSWGALWLHYITRCTMVHYGWPACEVPSGLKLFVPPHRQRRRGAGGKFINGEMKEGFRRRSLNLYILGHIGLYWSNGRHGSRVGSNIGHILVRKRGRKKSCSTEFGKRGGRNGKMYVRCTPY